MRRPLKGYALLLLVYNAATVAAIGLAKRAGRLPKRPPPTDVVLVGLATHRLSRLIARDRVASVVRAPFTEPEAGPASGAVAEAPAGSGVRRAIGELVLCPFCVAQWVATALMVALVYAPRVTRWIAATFTSVEIADFLQLAYVRLRSGD